MFYDFESYKKRVSLNETLSSVIEKCSSDSFMRFAGNVIPMLGKIEGRSNYLIEVPLGQHEIAY